MKRIYFPFLLILVLVFTSCAKQDSSDVNQAKIWTEYVASYNKANDVTDIVARFRFGGATGTLLELSDTTGASVYFNNQKMPYDALWGAHHLQIAGNVMTGTFKYTNTQGTVYSNNLPTGADTIGFPATFDTIVKSQAETFYWTGTALAPNQSVGMYVATWAWDKDGLFFTDADGATSFVMGAQAKNGLTVGVSTVYLSRSVETKNINGTSLGGYIKYTFTRQKENIHIVP